MFRVRFYDEANDIVAELFVKARNGSEAVRKVRSAEYDKCWASFVKIKNSL